MVIHIVFSELPIIIWLKNIITPFLIAVLITQTLGVACCFITLVLNLIAVRSKDPKTVRFCQVGIITLALFGGQ